MAEMSSRPGSDSWQAAPGIPLGEALELPSLQGAELVAGERGRDNIVRVVNIMEVPDIVRWMRGGEFLLTTAYPVRDDVDQLTAMVPALAERGLAALGVKVGPYLPEIPPELLAVADRLGFPVVALPAEVMFNDILSEVLGTVLNVQALELERSRKIHEQLTAVTLRGGSYEELMTVLRELSGCAAAVRDEQGFVLASAGDPDTDQPPTESRRIRVGGLERGEVAVWAPHERLLGHQLMALEHATTIATMVTAQERAVVTREQQHRALMLMELVSRQPRNRSETGRRAAAMGWDLHLPRAVVLVDLTDRDGGPPIDEHALEDQLVPLVRSAAGPHVIAWGVRTVLSLLLEPGDDLAATVQHVHDVILARHPGWSAAVAAGRVYDDFVDFHRSYDESVEALTLGRELYGDDFVLTYDELGIHRLLVQLPREELEELVRLALGPLLEYDAGHNGRLVESLGVYLLYNRNAAEAAEQLHVHYNTLRYRLQQIEKLTGGLDRHASSRLELELAVHAQRLLAAHAP